MRAAALCGRAGEGAKHQMGLSMDELEYEVQEEAEHLYFRSNGPFVFFVESKTVRAER